jgi:hypothetical protein
MDRSETETGTSPRDPLKGAPRLLARKVLLAQAGIAFERVWRALRDAEALSGDHGGEQDSANK